MITSPGAYPIWACLLHVPSLVLTFPVVAAAAIESRSEALDWHQLPEGLLYELLQVDPPPRRAPAFATYLHGRVL